MFIYDRRITCIRRLRRSLHTRRRAVGAYDPRSSATRRTAAYMLTRDVLTYVLILDKAKSS